MGTQLSIDLDKLTCGELLRFADALRACGVPPDTPVRHGGSPEGGRSPQLQVTLPDVEAAPPRPNRPYSPGPMRPISVPPAWSGPLTHPAGPPTYPAGPFAPGMLPRRESASWRIRVSFPGGEWGRDLSPDQVSRWRGALSEALAVEALSGPSQRGLMEIRDLFGALG